MAVGLAAVTKQQAQSIITALEQEAVGIANRLRLAAEDKAEASVIAKLTRRDAEVKAQLKIYNDHLKNAKDEQA